jgi:hypothetical protein
VTINEDESIPLLLTATDPESDPITFVIFTGPSNGTLSGSCPDITYTPRANFNGTDSYVFKVRDSFNPYQYATVTIYVLPVNDTPVLAGGSATTNANTPVAIPLFASDVDNDPLSFFVTRQPANGTVAVNGATATYSPNTNFSGADSFAVAASDGAILSLPANFNVTVSAVNRPPVAADDAVRTSPGTAVTFDVLSNDSDPDGHRFSLTAHSAPSRGPVVCSPGGSCTYSPVSAGEGSDGFTYTITDIGGASSSGSVSIEIRNCPEPFVSTFPFSSAAGLPTTGMVRWSGADAPSYDVYFGPRGQGCSTLYETVGTQQSGFSGLLEGADYEWRVVARKQGCQPVTSECSWFSTATSCSAAPPALIEPSNNSSSGPSAILRWTPVSGAESYSVFISTGNGVPRLAAVTSATSHTLDVPGGTVEWYVEAIIPGCGTTQSQHWRLVRNGDPCTDLRLPHAVVAAVVGEVTAGERYRVTWTSPVEGLTWEVQESNNDSFSGATSRMVAGYSTEYSHLVHSPTPYYYRVRPAVDCMTDFSVSSRVVITPVPSASAGTPEVVAQAGNVNPIIQPVFIPGSAVAGKTGSDTSFTASTDKDWMTVSPSSGTIPPSGINLIVTADPRLMPAGSNVGTVNVTAPSGTAVAAVPVSVSLVSPVAPLPRTATPEHSLIIPAVAHVEGMNSSWRSDVRVANTGTQKIDYELTWSRAGTDATKDAKRTGFSLEGGQTVALNDIVRQWYGLGVLGDGANGVLEIRPVAKGGSVVNPSATIASSRLYNSTSKGTLGQFVPAIPLASFIGRGASVLSLQEIRNSAQHRTNFGVVEGAGEPATVAISVFSTAGEKLDEFTVDLKPGELRHFDGFLPARGLTAAEARVEVRVLSETGRVSAWASVVDSRSGDPLMVTGLDLSSAISERYVIPGAADLRNGQNQWETDLTLFNGGSAPILATATFIPADHPENAVSRPVEIAANSVKTFSGVVGALFGVTNATGAIHLTTESSTPLVATARTFDRRADGTYGQFIPAVTAADAVGSADRALQILQLEESERFRTNIGLVEMNGQPARVEITAIIPGSAAAPSVVVDLPAYGFTQIPVLRNMRLKGVYNGRISVRVLSGSGRIAAYGSIIDNRTQDPTYVPAQ